MEEVLPVPVPVPVPLVLIFKLMFLSSSSNFSNQLKNRSKLFDPKTSSSKKWDENLPPHHELRTIQFPNELCSSKHRTVPMHQWQFSSKRKSKQKGCCWWCRRVYSFVPMSTRTNENLKILWISLPSSWKNRTRRQGRGKCMSVRVTGMEEVWNGTVPVETHIQAKHFEKYHPCAL